MYLETPLLLNGDPFDFKWGPVYNFMHCHVILQLNVCKLYFFWCCEGSDGTLVSSIEVRELDNAISFTFRVSMYLGYE